jgi:hypothetical protein
MPSHLTTHGPGCINKYATINYTPVLVNYRQRKGNRVEDGRAIFENHNNPYQFDKTTLNRQLVVEQKIGERRLAEDIKFAEETMGDKMYDGEPESARSRGSSRTLSVRSQSMPIDIRKATPTYDQSPVGLRPALRRQLSNTVLNLPNNTPGYSGYIEAKRAENVFGYRQSHLNSVCRDHRVGPGRKYDGISGFIHPPVPYGTPA